MDFLEAFKKGIEEIAHSNDLEKENKELKQKLAEKEKELEDRIECYKTARDLYWDENAKAFDYRDLYEKEKEKNKELKQKLNIALEDFNEIQKEHDKLCDMVVEKDKKIELLNKELSNECDEHLKFVGEADSMVKDLKKAFRFAIFELDFARHHSQSTTTETMERIERLTDEIWQKATKIKGEL